MFKNLWLYVGIGFLGSALANIGQRLQINYINNRLDRIELAIERMNKVD